jgi:undecaprenyl-diphosphatase
MIDLWTATQAILLGLVEGFTEFLPISSTGHLIIAESLLQFKDHNGVFSMVIQVGAIAAILWEYRQKFIYVLTHLWTAHSAAQKLFLNLVIAFMPLAVVGLVFGKIIKAHLFNPVSVAVALVVGGLVILWVERKPDITPRITDSDQVTPLDALKIGLAQVLALIPGTSRSGATIIGGVLFGLSRKVATEFSFFLAVPTIIAASVYDIYKHRADFVLNDIPVYGLGLLFAFISAFFTIRSLIRYVSNHNFAIFGWYRIALGGLILLSHYLGWITWAV